MKILFIYLFIYFILFAFREMDHFDQVLLKTLGGPTKMFSSFPWDMQVTVMIRFFRTCLYLAFHFFFFSVQKSCYCIRLSNQSVKLHLGSLQYPGKTQKSLIYKKNAKFRDKK